MATARPALRLPANPSETAEYWFDHAAVQLELEPELRARLRDPAEILSHELRVAMADDIELRLPVRQVRHNGIRGAYLTDLQMGRRTDQELAATAQGITWTAALYDLPFGGSAAAVACDEAATCEEIVKITEAGAARWREQVDPLRELLWVRSANGEVAAARAIAAVLLEASDTADLRWPVIRVAIHAADVLWAVLCAQLVSLGCDVVRQRCGQPMEQCDVLVLACANCFMPDSSAIEARLIVEGAGIALSPFAERMLADRGVIVVPNLLAGAGELIAQYVEWQQRLQRGALSQAILQRETEARVMRAYRRVRDRAERDGWLLREAAMCEAVEQVARAERLRAG